MHGIVHTCHVIHTVAAAAQEDVGIGTVVASSTASLAFVVRAPQRGRA